jgi:penicillin-binding protein 2
MAKQLAGAVVAMEVRTGRILALYSKPEFDPNEVSGAQGRARLREAFARLRVDPLNPLLDKTTTGAFPPGSTFKPFAALAGLEDDAIRPEKNEVCNQYVFYGKRRFKCTHMHGVVNLRSAIAQSCNIYFFKLAEAVGIDRFARIGQLFGFGERTGLAINPESPGRMPTRAYYTNLFRGSYKIGFSLNTAIGQGAMTATPVQLASAYAAIGNGGTLYVPQVVRSVLSNDGDLLQEFNPRVRRTIPMKPQNLARIMDGLKQVVDSTHGTARALRDPALPVAGKTGTAQVGYVARAGDDPKWAWYYSRDDAWFAALYPSQAPELALVVLVEHGASGPAVAAPIAFDILRSYAQLSAKRKGSVR